MPLKGFGNFILALRSQWSGTAWRWAGGQDPKVGSELQGGSVAVSWAWTVCARAPCECCFSNTPGGRQAKARDLAQALGKSVPSQFNVIAGTVTRSGCACVHRGEGSLPDGDHCRPLHGPENQNEHDSYVRALCPHVTALELRCGNLWISFFPNQLKERH